MGGAPRKKLREQLARHLSTVHLRRYQAARRAYHRACPPPPSTWSTWRAAKAWQDRYEQAMRPYLRLLARARARIRDGLCRGLI